MTQGSGNSYDAVVIGGGPAGAAAGTKLALAGRRVLLLERQRFPRFHIGESLLPATNRYLTELGVAEQVRVAGFVEKRGASFLSDDGERRVRIDFARSRRVPRPVTFQVERHRFDELLLQRCAESGAEVRQETRVTGVELAPEGVTVHYRDTEGDGRVAARYLVDASGQAGFLAKRLRLRRALPRLRNAAVHAQFEGIRADAGEAAGDIRVISLRGLGWMWLIPLSETVTSVGAVVPHAAAELLGGERPLEKLLRQIPATAALLTPRLRRRSRLRRDADYSYRPTAYAGPRWLLAGDAGSFLDPVFSTGVLLALRSGCEAAEAVHGALVHHDGERFLRRYHRRQRRLFRFFQPMVEGFYDPAFRDLFFEPANHLGIMEALVTALAGHDDHSLRARCQRGLFRGLVMAQRVLPLAPRRHGSGPGPMDLAQPSSESRLSNALRQRTPGSTG